MGIPSLTFMAPTTIQWQVGCVYSVPAKILIKSVIAARTGIQSLFPCDFNLAQKSGHRLAQNSDKEAAEIVRNAKPKA